MRIRQSHRTITLDGAGTCGVKFFVIPHIAKVSRKASVNVVIPFQNSGAEVLVPMNNNIKVIVLQVLHKIKAEGSKIWNWSSAASEAKYFGDSFVRINNCNFDKLRRIFEDVL